jgi:hypothetical protein
MDGRPVRGVARQIVGGIGWTIFLLGSSALVSLVAFVDSHRAVYERVPPKNLLAVAVAGLVGLGVVVTSRRTGRERERPRTPAA